MKLKTVIKKESKDNSVITVKLVGGVIDWVEIPENLQAAVVVVDYDVEGSDEPLDKDEQGDECKISVWKKGK